METANLFPSPESIAMLGVQPVLSQGCSIDNLQL
jgi:hypothetical protein